LIRDLGLSTYFYLNHLPKNGLRFIFDDGNKPFRVEDCSEIGSTMFPVFQLSKLIELALIQICGN